MTKDKWVWMPHPGHLIVSRWCRFHLTTRVGKYLVSTVGEYWPDRQVREIHAKVHDPQWLIQNGHRKGDDFDHAYMKRFGYEEIGVDRKYETMVFPARKSNTECCPFTAASWEGLELDGYESPEQAFKGHLALCQKYSKK